jgi:hypothetical protein
MRDNNSEALLHIVISIEEAFQRDPMVPNRLGPVDPFALAQVLEDLTPIGNLTFLAARLASQDSDKELEADRADMRRLT